MKINENGYTLIELFVVMFTIILMGSILLSGYSTVDDQKALSMSVSRLAQDLRETQEKSLAPSSEKKELCSDASPSEDRIRQLIFGAYFQQGNDSYVLFVDCNDDKDYDSGVDKQITPIGLDNEVMVSKLSKNGNPPVSNLSIVFIPPSPDLYIDGSFGTTEVEIEVALKNDTTKNQTIRINKSGLIEIE